MKSYREKQPVYAERYGVSVRTIKLWIADGRACKPPRLPPLDDPSDMPDWWVAVKHNRPPAGILSAAAAKQAPYPFEDPPALAASQSPSQGSAPASPAPPPALEIGFAASLQRVRQAEAEANARYLAAFNLPEEERNDAAVSRLRREWSELSEQLRFLEKAAPEVLAKSGEMIARDDVRRLLVQKHAPIVAGVRTLFRRLRAKTGASLGAGGARPESEIPAPTAEEIAEAVAKIRTAGGTLAQAADTFARRGQILDDFERVYSLEVERLFADLCDSGFVAV